MYDRSSILTLTRLGIGYTQGKCSDAQHKECIGEQVDEVDQATEGFPFVVKKTSYQRVLQQIQSLMLSLFNGIILLYYMYTYTHDSSCALFHSKDRDTALLTT